MIVMPPDDEGSRRGTRREVKTLVTGQPPRRSRLKREVLLLLLVPTAMFVDVDFMS